MDIRSEEEKFLELHWGMNCQPGMRKGKNIRRRTRKEHRRTKEERMRQAEQQFNKTLDKFCEIYFSDDDEEIESSMNIFSSDDTKLGKKTDSDSILNKGVNRSDDEHKYQAALNILQMND